MVVMEDTVTERSVQHTSAFSSDVEDLSKIGKDDSGLDWAAFHVCGNQNGAPNMATDMIDGNWFTFNGVIRFIWSSELRKWKLTCFLQIKLRFRILNVSMEKWRNADKDHAG